VKADALRAVTRGIGLALLALGGLLAAVPGLGADRVPKPVITIEQPGRCVEETSLMRRDHADMLKAQRDLTVRDGIRTAKHSLKECVSCHAAKSGSVLGEKGFCQSCHEYAGVRIDCFECHAAKRNVADGPKP
jgi:hypothetical protein